MSAGSELKSKAIRAAPMPSDLTPEEYFVWSRLGDGLKVKDLIPLCPWPEDETLSRLKNLLEKKAASIIDSRSSDFPSEVNTQSFRPDRHEDISAQLDEDENDPELKLLSREFRMSILLKFKEVQDAGPFDILEISNRSTETDIRNAYLRLSKQFHPDRFFTKKLGTYKRKLEIVFAKIQFAHNLLKDPIEREALVKRLHLSEPKSKLAEAEAPSSISQDQKRKLINPEMERIGRAEHLYKQGLKLQESKDFIGAANSFSLAMQSNPQRPQYSQAFETVKPLMQIQKARESIERAEKALKLAGASTEVLKAAEEALKLDPSLVEAHLIIGRCLVELNMNSRMRDAKELLMRAKAAFPKNADACVYLGRALKNLGDLEGAERAYREALKRDPRHAAAKKYLEKDIGNP